MKWVVAEDTMQIEAESKNTREMFLEGSERVLEGGIRSRTSTRMVYEAQVSVIKKQLGDLEKIRTDLGLSQRKICQLLMVDPSAWTRWNRGGEEAPPHVWRALQWYMTLQENIPGLTPQYFIGKDPQILHEKALLKISEEKTHREALEVEIRHLRGFFHEQQENFRKNLRFHRVLSYLLIGSSFLMALLFIFAGRNG